MKVILLPLNPTVGALAQNADLLLAAARQAAASRADAVLLPALALEGAPLLDLPRRPDYLQARKTTIARLNRRLPPHLPLFTTTANPNAPDSPLTLGRQLPPHTPTPCTFLSLSTPLHLAPYPARLAPLAQTARRDRKTIAFVNLLGGQDDSLFDGAAGLILPNGTLYAETPRFTGRPLTLHLPLPTPTPTPTPLPPLSSHEERWAALTLAIRDYITKNNARGALVALSGGLDSALVAALAVDALGPNKVLGATFPSPYSSAATRRDAHRLAAALAIDCLQIPITPALATLTTTLASPDAHANFKKFPPLPLSLEHENLQARIRGLLAMALANRYGLFLLETSNRSEALTGYSTLYGDTCGAFSPIAPLYKTEVFDLARWRNQQQKLPPIPPTIIARPPSAELHPGQRDSDSLPPYHILDPLLRLLCDQGLGPSDAAAAGFDPRLARRILSLSLHSEYKRRQTPPGPRLAPPPPSLPSTNAFLPP